MIDSAERAWCLLAALDPVDVKSVQNSFSGSNHFLGGGQGDSMKKLMIALVAVLAVTMVARYSLADREVQKINGVLIDAKCGKGKTEEAAAKHPQACVMKCCDGGQALTLVSGDKTYTLDDA